MGEQNLPTILVNPSKDTPAAAERVLPSQIKNKQMITHKGKPLTPDPLGSRPSTRNYVVNEARGTITVVNAATCPGDRDWVSGMTFPLVSMPQHCSIVVLLNFREIENGHLSPIIPTGAYMPEDTPLAEAWKMSTNTY